MRLADCFKLVFLSLFLFIIINKADCQPGTGMPVFIMSPINNSGAVVINWKATPAGVSLLENISPALRAGANTAINKCGDPVFYAIHSGILNTSHNLFIYDPDGNPLLNNSTGNGPGLNSKAFAEEYQLINVPGSILDWYLIYPEWMPNSGAPLNDGFYLPARILYSKIRYRCSSIEVIERDVPITVSGFAYKYSNGLAISVLPENPDQLCLYATRRDLSSDFLSLDRFLINGNGIFFEKNTGNINTDTWNLTVAGAAIEVTSDGKRIAINNRDQSTNGDNFIILDATAFDNQPSNFSIVSVDELILQPDNIILINKAPVATVAMNNSSLYFLQNIESKIYDIEFSPSGEYLYFVNGGFSTGGMTNMTYLGQIDIGTYSAPKPYPYDLRLQIQLPPGNIDPYEGTGGSESMHPDTYHQLVYIKKAFNDEMYFVKRNTPYLFRIPYPDELMPQNLLPSEIDLSDASHPNITIIGKPWFLPDQIDGYDYINSVNPFIDLGNDTILCAGPFPLTPGPDFESYCWQDGSPAPVYNVTEPGAYWVEVIDQFGCIARDTINVEMNGLAINLGDDVSICPGDSAILTPGAGFPNYLWQDGSTGPLFIAKQPGIYWVEIIMDVNCIGRDTVVVFENPEPDVDLGFDQFICEGDVISLDAGSGFADYLWHDGSSNRILQVIDSGLVWVQVANAYGCRSRDSVHIAVEGLPLIEFGTDTLFVEELQVVLDAGPGFEQYLWQDGSTGQYFEVTENGWYYVAVSNEFCDASDTVFVILSDCEASLQIPNCFTPNSDGYNDIFNVNAQNINSFSLYIFNRWGQMIFETEDINQGWDGRINGNKCPLGTYFYLIRYTTPCSFGLEKSGERKGSVTLLE